MRKKHKFYVIGWLVNLSSRKKTEHHFQIEAYRYACFITSAMWFKIWFRWLGVWHNTCHIYWLDRWAETWFLSFLSKIYLHLALKVMQIKYRKTAWEPGILIFPLVEMVQATTLSNKTLFSVHLAQCTWHFFSVVRDVVSDFHMKWNSPILQQICGLSHLSVNIRPLLQIFLWLR